MYSNDPKNPRFTLRMKGEVKILAAFQPDRLFFKNAIKGSTKVQTVSLVGEKAKEIKLSDIKSTKPEVTAELVDKDGESGLKVTLKAPEKEGRFSALVTAKTGLKKPDELRLFVSAQVTGDLVPDRNYVLFSPFNKDHHPQFTLKIRSLSAKPFKITKITDPQGVVTGKPTPKGKDWEVVLTLSKEAKVPRGKLQIATNRSDQPVLNINYSIRASHPRTPIKMGRTGAASGKKPVLIPNRRGIPASSKIKSLQLKPGRLHVNQRNLPKNIKATAPAKP